MCRILNSLLIRVCFAHELERSVACVTTETDLDVLMFLYSQFFFGSKHTSGKLARGGGGGGEELKHLIHDAY